MNQESSVGGVDHSIIRVKKKPQSITPKKRYSNTVFPTMSVAHVDDDDCRGPHHHVEKSFPNGDIYTGQWSENRPHGHGKHLWSDGCMYVGDWSDGFTLGRGKFSWPSGATYEGRFENGYMDGDGTYIGSTGDTYRGAWARNARHGAGTRSYSNGDHYAGNWRRGLPDGKGRYTWRNGDQYLGEWRQGRMQGAGTLTWVAGGSQFDGIWEEGLPRGIEDPAEQSGAQSLRDCRVSIGEKIPVFPSEKNTSWGGFGSESDSSCNECSGSGRDRPSGYRRWPRTRRQGHTISKGHKNYELMLNLQLGIRHSAGSSTPTTTLDLKGSAFDPNDKTWTRFPPKGSKQTPPHQSSEFKWKDYCPLVFRTLRKLFKVDPADYMISICGDDALRELSSPGKSGSFFYLTDDDKYMIKTMKKSEVKVLKRMLPAYYNHVKAFENTLVTKFYGLHCVRMSGPSQKKVRFVVMGNLFCTEYSIHRRFDLKGSSHGRLTNVKPETKIDSTTTLKDLDLNLTFRMEKSWFQDFCRQVDRDCEFLEQERIMDYSLLVGIHFREVSPSGEPLTTKTNIVSGNGYQTPPLSIRRLGCDMRARAEVTVSRNVDGEAQMVREPTGEYYDVILVFGIIDILQDYDISKKLEHAYKSFQYDPASISAVDPKQYSRRFRDFILRVFTEDSDGP